MFKAEWLACENPGRMLAFVTMHPRRPAEVGARNLSDRKLRLFACACVRAVWGRLTGEASRRAVEAAERYADGLGHEADLEWARNAARLAKRKLAGTARFLADEAEQCCHEDAAYAAEYMTRDVPGCPLPAQAALLRDIADNPFRPVTLSDRLLIFGPSDRTGWYWGDDWHALIRGLATAAHDERLPDGFLDTVRLLVLADALEEAGCPDGDLLRHLRGEERNPACVAVAVHASHEGDCWRPLRGPHVRGCWALDLVLGKE